MQYDWTEEKTNAPAIPEGYHRVTINKILTADKKGNGFERDGNRRILVVVETANGEEAMSNFDVEGKFDWTLRKLVQVCGLDTQRMNDEGVTPADFLDQRFADEQLKGRQLWAEVVHKPGSNGKVYCNWNPVPDDDVPAYALTSAPRPSSIEGPGKRRVGAGIGAGAADPITDADIPFAPLEPTCGII